MRCFSAAPSLNEVPPPRPSPACDRMRERGHAAVDATHLFNRPGKLLPLPFRAADHTLGDQAVDLARRISEFRQHRGRVLAEFRRHVAQTWLAARKPDRGGDALVPVLFDDVAAMDGMGAGQRLVDRLHRSGRQSAASSRSHSGSASCWLNTAASSARSASRLAMRSLLRAKRGSDPSSGLPISLASLRKVPSLPTPMKISAVRVGKIAYGTRLGCSLPVSCGGLPCMK